MTTARGLGASKLLPFTPAPVRQTPDQQLARSRALRDWLASTDNEPPPPHGALPVALDAWPEDQRYEFEERAGILQYSAGLARDEAEGTAEAMVRAAFASLHQRRGSTR